MMQLMLSNLSNVYPMYPLSTYLIIYSMQNWIYKTQYFAKKEWKTDIVNVCLQKTISNSGRFLWEYLRNQKYLKLTSSLHKHGTKTKKWASCYCFRCIVFSKLVCHLHNQVTMIYLWVLYCTFFCFYGNYMTLERLFERLKNSLF